MLKFTIPTSPKWAGLLVLWGHTNGKSTDSYSSLIVSLTILCGVLVGLMAWGRWGADSSMKVDHPGMKSYPRVKVAGKIVCVMCVFFFFCEIERHWKNKGDKLYVYHRQGLRFFPRKVICQRHSFIDVRLWFWMQIKKTVENKHVRHVLHFFTSRALRQAWFLYNSRRRSMEELLPDAPLVEFAREQLGWMQDAAES